MIQEKRERLPAILQAFDMSNETASFYPEEKVSGRPFMPALKGLFGREAVERDIQFDRVEMFRVEFEPLSLW